MDVLQQRVSKEGLLTLYSGAMGTSVATLLGHYPWFVTYNFLQSKVPPAATGLRRQLRSAVIGFISSFVSDVVSNSVCPFHPYRGSEDVGSSLVIFIPSLYPSLNPHLRILPSNTSGIHPSTPPLDLPGNPLLLLCPLPFLPSSSTSLPPPFLPTELPA